MELMAPLDHSILSPSGSHTTERCAAAGIRQFLVTRRVSFLRDIAKHKFPEVCDWLDPELEASIKGNAFHDIQQRYLQLKIWGVGEEFDVEKAFRDVDGVDFEIDVMMSIMDEIVESADGAEQVWIEKRFENKGLDSGGSPDYAMLKKPVLTVRDLKTGRLEVNPDNSQFKRYACGIMDSLGWPDDITEVVLKVDAFNFSGGTHKMTVAELIEYRDSRFEPAMLRGNQINPEATAGDHCVYCDARIHCPEFRAHINDPSVDQLFDKEFHEVTSPELEQMWERVKLVGKLESALKAEMIARMNCDMGDGEEEFTQYKQKEGAKNTRITDEEGLVKLLIEKEHGEDALYEPKKKTVKKLLTDTGLDKEDISKYITEGRNKPSIVLK